jgi:5-hydroxyisourate hydrolase
MPTLSTHVLDTSTGRPAEGLAVRLENAAGALARAATDAGGRIRDLGPKEIPAGRYRLVFETGAWFAAGGRTTLFPEVVIPVELQDGEPHYHIPLLVSPFGYSTYRGS